MRKSIIRTLSVVLLISILVPFAVSAYAYGQEGYVNRDNVNMRISPNGTVIATYNLGTTLTLLNESNAWCQVNVNGTIGWIHGKYVSLGTQAATTTGLRTPATITTACNGYAGCDYSARVICSIPAGSPVTLMTNEANNWNGITYNGMRVYVYGGNLNGKGGGGGGSTPSPSPVGSLGYINRNGVNFRIAPNSTVIGNFGIGTTLTLLGESNGWCKVNINGIVGYVYGQYVSLGTQSSTTTGINQPGYVNAGLVYFRKGANTIEDVISTLPKYTKLTIVSEENTGWCGVIVNGVRGYIYGAYVSKGNPPA